MKKHYTRLRLILGDQLNASHSWFHQKDNKTLYVLAELKQETNYVTHHVQKVCAFFAAMQAFATALHSADHEVLHLTLDDTQGFTDINQLLLHLFIKYKISHFEYQLPDEFRLRQQLSNFSQSIDVYSSVVESEHFFLSEQQIQQDFKPQHKHRMEAFYRKMRERHQILMEDDEPSGGKWNYDKQNQNKLKKEQFDSVPEPLVFATDVSDILTRLKRHKITMIGEIDEVNQQLLWPVNRLQAKELLTFFCQYCLPLFGKYQDAMTGKLDDIISKRQWSLFHSRLSFALNAKIISPKFVIKQAIEHYQANRESIDIAQIEGFVRQILGWREFVRGIYWRNMPDYGELNALQAHTKLPSWFWNGNTKMNCLSQTIKQSLQYSYAHHIQRLMITGNFCLLTGIEPDQVDAWYLGIYVDAIEWVELPNTRGMSQFADGGIVGSKAYAASGNYVNKMSDYCSDCKYKVKEITGEQACPMNALYWQFMVKHQEKFNNNPRNRMVYANWFKKTPEQQQLILEKAQQSLQDIENL